MRTRPVNEEAKAAFQEVAVKAREGNNPPLACHRATTGLGDMAIAQGSLGSAERLFRSALAMAEDGAKADPRDTAWQQALSTSHDRIGRMLQAQGNLGGALESYKASLAITERLTKIDASNTGGQQNLAASHDRRGGVLQAQGNHPVSGSPAAKRRVSDAAPLDAAAH